MHYCDGEMDCVLQTELDNCWWKGFLFYTMTQPWATVDTAVRDSECNKGMTLTGDIQ